mmetsp:Transcript_174/g.224  ORF Transcript_174/g.224 Transcript_174/m.224 type:complete len:244 (+) Transcript_174:327-1058(+)|eukprot:CAMPEP_0184020042 /NCGR_PEP_ID=MMETSP0954-20121128/9120_1 /TAXON_ID=627963 /ORGANISM="Aplanochytrium sp, Strain PBS07" /LENGTH=243 /DNA_ID=CAMNT_0026301841 /DNA_START=337 /DNA_END=1068 /DNA_ORIENTATION=-
MFETNSEYDRGVNTFSPQGRILQVEYAMKAVTQGSTVLGIQTSQGVVLGVEKRLESPLVEPDSVKKIHQIDYHLCAATCGVVSDARTLIDKARTEAQNHTFTYTELIPCATVAQSIGDTILGFGKGEDMPSRPFGVAILIAGCDHHGPKLFNADPAGSFTEWKAKAIGSGSESAQTLLEEEFNENLSLEQAKKIIVKILRQVMEEAITPNNVEICYVTDDGNAKNRYHVMDADELSAVIGSLN